MTRSCWPGLFLLVASLGCPNKLTPVPSPDAGTTGPLARVEKEPNNRPTEALSVPASAEITASLGADPAHPDEDWYRLVPPERGAVELRLGGVPGVELSLELTDADQNPLLAVTPGLGLPARVENLTVPEGTLVRVRAAKKGQSGAYTLWIAYGARQPDFEAEPNERAVDATPLPLGARVQGHLGHGQDLDWYRVELPSPSPETSALPSPKDTPDASSDASSEEPPALAAQDDAGAPAPHPEDEAPTSLRLELSAVPHVRLELTLLSAAEAILFSARGDEGEPLSLRNIGIRAQDTTVYVVVKSAGREVNPETPYALTVAQEEATAASEREPNDTRDKATILPAGSYREGFLSPQGDLDHYVVPCPSPALLRAQVSGVERLDLVLSVVRAGLDGGSDAVVMRANDGALKEPEQLNSVACQKETVFRVEGGSRKVDGKVVRDFESAQRSYRLTVTATSDSGGEEREPNGSVVDATPLSLGRAMRGTVFPKKDTDWYRLDLSGRAVRTPLRATLTGILKVDLGLYLHRVEDDGSLSLVQTADRAKGEAPETIRYSAEPGVYVLEVRDSRGRGEANFQDPYQLTVSEDD